MFNFSRDKKPRIAYKEQRNGVRIYCIETWKCYECGCGYYQESAYVNSLDEAKELLKDISDREIIKQGII